MANPIRRITKLTLVFLNILTAVLFLLGSYSYYFDPAHFWFIGLLTLASFYLLLILVFFIFFWMFVKFRLVIISILAIAFAWKPMHHLFEIRLTPNFTMEKHPNNIRIMSWNVEHFDILEHKTHPERKQQMIDIINMHQPDVACFQEMVASDSAPSAINYLPDFRAKLHMLGYHYSYNRKLDFDGKHRFGIITFSKYPIINKHTLSYTPNDYNSIFQYVDIVREEDTFRIFNIHLQSLKFSNENMSYIEKGEAREGTLSESKSLIAKFRTGFLKRKIQSERIKAAMNASPYPVIVCGDFNDVPNSYAYSTIGNGLKNTFAEKGTGIGRTFYGISPTLRIDNIFCDTRFNVEQFVRVKKKLSDHFPIIADLSFTR
jgi:endonuclease/exonuclease/phosphatase family metal-dependent hydrolase